MTFSPRFFILFFLTYITLPSFAHDDDEGSNNTPQDTIRHLYLHDVVVTSDPKSNTLLSGQPISYSIASRKMMESLGLTSLKQTALFVPNLFIPEYGSKLTSAIYIRGIGSRINSPVVGMYVDDVSFNDKSAYDFHLLGIDHIEVLRGPQSTLYGHNTMGGLIKIYTRSPHIHGTEIHLGATTRHAGREASFLTSQGLGEDVSFSIGGFYKGNDGNNHNSYLDKRSNGLESAGGRFRLLATPHKAEGLTLDFTTTYEYSDEDGYDYYYTGDGTDASYDTYKKRIVADQQGYYRRSLLNTSFKTSYKKERFSLNNVISYQWLNDHMFMDQDFSPMDIFTLTQKQKLHNLTDELTLKGEGDSRWDWTAGAFFSRQWLKTNAPVEFGSDGIQRFIQSGIDTGLSKANAAMNPFGMAINLNVDDAAPLWVEGRFSTPTINTALFGQATLKDVITEGLDLTAGLRIDYEHSSMRYHSGCNVPARFTMTAGTATLYDILFSSKSIYDGKMKNDDWQVVPKVALTYHLDTENLIYGSVSKGFRSGGYNLQMFSELIQASLRNDMMSELAQLAPAIASNFSSMIGENPAADSTIHYKPEESWNFEIGTHFSLFDGRLRADFATFFIDIHNQQVARYSDAGFGRMMVNAGHSHSCGLELALTGLLDISGHDLSLTGSYGYTHSEFKRYDEGEDKGVSRNYKGNIVPFAPEHQMALAADYQLLRSKKRHADSGWTFRQLIIGANVTGQGRVYWTEDNRYSQPFYALVGVHTGIDFGKMTVNLWVKNLFNHRYVPFFFESMSKGFAQISMPRQAGVDVRLRF